MRTTYAGRSDVEQRASVLTVVEERVSDDLAVSLVRAAAATREAEGVACGSRSSTQSASTTREPGRGRIRLTAGAADVGDGAVGTLTLGNDAVRRDVRGVVAARGHELDVAILADEALVRDGLASALGGAGGADETCVRRGEEGSGDGDQSGELHDDLRGARKKREVQVGGGAVRSGM